VLIWAVTGPVFKYSETWQLVINTGTTIVTLLMVFLIQKIGNALLPPPMLLSVNLSYNWVVFKNPNRK
jgi:low affinity Fe/Cu permease